MTTSTVNLYTLNYTESKTYVWAAAFILGNIALPQLFHLIPQGGMIFLPIYFFTLIGAYKFGWKVGLLTAVLSPLINSALFGMPATAMIPAILIKSVVLALIAGLVAQRFQKATLPLLIAVILGYQFVGGLGEWAITGSLEAALQDIRLGLPGILLQIFGCYLLINYVIRK
ncbi:MAG: ECF transporter S component [Phocaeicola sp.]|uniref:ECF transporter S component n=1 Tax=Phocaeicola TaxID=909656 RepID=UPI00234F12D9|nr:ECF transporter S component [Phocaeicola oris]MCE2617365.1 ECF transporter S component [Phocaeicola oris]